MSQAVLAAFPTRPMRVKRHGMMHPFVMFIATLVGLGIIAMVIISATPGILRDWEIAKDPVIARQASVSNGKCTTRQAVFTDCKVTVNYSIAGNRTRTQLEFAFFDIHSGDYTVQVITSASKPELVTVDLALDKLWNRIITATFLSLIGAGLTLAGLWGMAKQMNVRRAFRAFNDKSLRAVPVEIISLSKNYGMHTAVYRFDARGKKHKLSTGLRKQVPFYLNAEAGDTTALGVTDQYGDYVLLLDEALERLDFTDAERAVLHNARDHDEAMAVTAPQNSFPTNMAGIEPAR